MSISNIFESGETKENRGHFRNLVMLARVDGHVSEEEKALLNKIGKSIGLSDSEAAGETSSFRISPT